MEGSGVLPRGPDFSANLPEPAAYPSWGVRADRGTCLGGIRSTKGGAQVKQGLHRAPSPGGSEQKPWHRSRWVGSTVAFLLREECVPPSRLFPAPPLTHPGRCLPPHPCAHSFTASRDSGLARGAARRPRPQLPGFERPPGVGGTRAQPAARAFREGAPRRREGKPQAPGSSGYAAGHQSGPGSLYSGGARFHRGSHV